MKTITGNLTMLGHSQRIGLGGWNYSVIEIGGQILKKISAIDALDTFLHRALDQRTGNTTLYIASLPFPFSVKMIVGRGSCKTQINDVFIDAASVV